VDGHRVARLGEVVHDVRHLEDVVLAPRAVVADGGQALQSVQRWKPSTSSSSSRATREDPEVSALTGGFVPVVRLPHAEDPAKQRLRPAVLEDGQFQQPELRRKHFVGIK